MPLKPLQGGSQGERIIGDTQDDAKYSSAHS